MLNKVLPTWCLCIEASVFPCPKAAAYTTEFTLSRRNNKRLKFALEFTITKETQDYMTGLKTGDWFGETELKWSPAFYRQQVVVIGWGWRQVMG